MMEMGLEVSTHPIRANGSAALILGDIDHIRVIEVAVVVADDRLKHCPEVVHAEVILYVQQ